MARDVLADLVGVSKKGAPAAVVAKVQALVRRLDRRTMQ